MNARMGECVVGLDFPHPAKRGSLLDTQKMFPESKVLKERDCLEREDLLGIPCCCRVWFYAQDMEVSLC